VIRSFFKIYNLISLFWITYLSSPLVDIAKYEYGFFYRQNILLKYFISGLSASLNYLIIFFLFLFIIWVVRLWRYKITNIERRRLLLLIASSIVFFATSKYLINLELNKYPNYLYSQSGLYFDKLRFMSDLCLLVLMFCFSTLYKNKYGTESHIRSKHPNLWQRFVLQAKQIISILSPPLVIIGFFLSIVSSLGILTAVNYIYQVSQISYLEKYGKEISILSQY